MSRPTMMTAVFTAVVAVLLVAAAATTAAAGQATPARLAPGDPFPDVSGKSLSGGKTVLPEAAAGRVALVMMGFTYESRHAVEKFGVEVRAACRTEPGFTFYEVPVIGGMGRLARWFIDSGMRRGTPRELHEHVITVYGGVDRLKTAMGFTQAGKDHAYLTLIDRSGKVRWQHRGPWEQAAFEELKAEIAAALGRQ